MKQPPVQKQIIFNGISYRYELYVGGVKRLNLRIRPDGSIRVSVPRATSQRQIDDFLLRSMPQMSDTLARIKAKQSKTEALPSEAEQAEKKEKLLALILTCHKDVILPRFAALNLPLTDQQRRYIASPTAIKIHPMKSRWGSCNYIKGTLNFNLFLLDQPVECIEYVVMHEFAHFVQPDHSSAFHALMTALMPDWKERKSRLST